MPSKLVKHNYLTVQRLFYERRNVPALPSRAQHVFSAEPQDKQHTDVGYRQIQRRQGRLLFYPFLLWLSSLLFILFDKK